MKKSACDRNHDLVIQLAQSGMSLAKIGKRVGTKGSIVLAHLRRHGQTMEFPNGCPGEKNPNWKGGRTIDKSGYVLVRVPDHPHRNRAGYVREHRIVMEKHIGRLLDPKETVHHKNSNKQDNRIENLELFSSNAIHLKHELTGRVPKWTEAGKANIREAVILSANRRRGKSPHLWTKHGG